MYRCSLNSLSAILLVIGKRYVFDVLQYYLIVFFSLKNEGMMG